MMHWKYQLVSMVILIFVTTTAWTQDKGGRWQFENIGFDTADWDNLEDSGTLQGAVTYSETDPSEGIAYLWVDANSVNNASGLASGIYIYRLESSSGFSQIRKMILFK